MDKNFLQLCEQVDGLIRETEKVNDSLFSLCLLGDMDRGGGWGRCHTPGTSTDIDVGCLKMVISSIIKQMARSNIKSDRKLAAGLILGVLDALCAGNAEQKCPENDALADFRQQMAN